MLFTILGEMTNNPILNPTSAASPSNSCEEETAGAVMVTLAVAAIGILTLDMMRRTRQLDGAVVNPPAEPARQSLSEKIKRIAEALARY